MAVDTDADLADAVQKAGLLLQDIQSYVKRDFTKKARIRFPRGYIRTASVARSRLAFMSSSHLKDNIAYTMMLADVQHWLIARTDLSGTAMEMVIKLQLFLYASIVESITQDHLHGKRGGYCKRLQIMEDNHVISSDLRLDLEWLWELRNRMHLFLLDDTEWSSSEYTTINLKRGVNTFDNLLTALNMA
jgi:hypothetical protein